MYKGKTRKNNTYVSLVLNTGLTCLELATGIIIGSAALVADGLKNLTDSLLLLVALAAEKMCQKDKHNAQRIRDIAGWFNITILLFITAEIFYESMLSLRRPNHIHGAVVIAVAISAIAINVIAAVLIRRQQQSADRVAFFGLLSSALSGGCVLVSGILHVLYGIHWVDGVAGLTIAGILLVIDIKLLKTMTSPSH
jgi:cation diffusion facilitator family transporter